MKNNLFAMIIAFVVSLIFCRILIPLLRRWKAGQNILVYVKEHKGKSGTPTMGGIAFVLAAVITAVLFVSKAEQTFIVSIVIGLSYMIVGLLDDFFKQKHKENLGLRAWQKFLFQAIIAVFSGIYCIRAEKTFLNIPFLGISFDVGYWILPLIIFVFLATVNAVNLTDGLDGLAAGTSIPFFLSIGILVFLQGGASPMTVLSFALVGAISAYLLFNAHPASIFMGDTGSLALGGFAATISCFTGNLLYVAVIGFCFVLSVISVIIQVIYYKVTRGKRVFLMAPIHHHFQQKGYSETRIACAYSIITFMLGGLCVAMAF